MGGHGVCQVAKMLDALLHLLTNAYWMLARYPRYSNYHTGNGDDVSSSFVTTSDTTTPEGPPLMLLSICSH